MNNICLCGCNQPLPPHTSGRRQKFINDAHRMAFSRKNKIKTLPPHNPATPTDLPQTSSPQPLIGQNGVDYSDPYKVLPPHIAAYMPIQSHQSKSDLNTLEKAIHGHQPLKSSRPPTF